MKKLFVFCFLSAKLLYRGYLYLVKTSKKLQKHTFQGIITFLPFTMYSPLVGWATR